MKTVVLIPAYKPNKLLIKTLKALKEHRFAMLVVDDGSGSSFAPIFSEAQQYARVIAHRENRGKGAALKFGLSKVEELFGDCDYVITADADGQHSIDDICAMRDKLEEGAELVIGSRSFTGKIPFFSRLGNNTSRFVYCLLTGYYLRDNQMGLRGFPVKHIRWMLLPGGERYDYEMNVLVYAAKQNIKITEMPAKTIYIDGNSGSHFHPAWDTLRIYKCIFSSAWATPVSILIGFIMILAHSACSGWDQWFSSLCLSGGISVAIGLLLSILFCFRGVRQRHILRTVCGAAIRYAAYAALLGLFRLIRFPSFFWAYFLTVILVMVGEFFLRRYLRKEKAGASDDK